MLELPKNEVNYYQLYQKNKWSKEEISKFKEMKDHNIQNYEYFNECLNTIYEYKLPFNQITSFDKENLHKIGIKNFFNKKSYDREIEELIKEHSEILKENQIPINSMGEDLIITQRVNKIKSLTKKYSYSKISIDKKTINENINYSDDDLIAIINNAVKATKNFYLKALKYIL